MAHKKRNRSELRIKLDIWKAIVNTPSDKPIINMLEKVTWFMYSGSRNRKGKPKIRPKSKVTIANRIAQKSSNSWLYLK
jgi:hypothetical protein